MKKVVKYLKKFNKFLKKDTFPSFLVTMILALIIIKFIFFPLLSLTTGTTLPLVIVESCSMHHKEPGMDSIVQKSVYENLDIELEDTADWDFQNGFNKGDVIFVIKKSEPEIGDVIIFQGAQVTPVIHRLITINEEDGETIYGTMGDNNMAQLKPNARNPTDETAIHEDQLVGKALFRVPAIGWLKLIFFEPGRITNKGTCTMQE